MARILLVDHYKRDQLTRALKSHQVVTAEDSEAAMGLVEGESFDLVVMTLVEGEQFSPEFIATARRTWPHSPLLVVAENDSDVALQAVSHGAFDVIHPPVTPERFEQAVKKALDHRQTEQTLNYLRHTQEHLIYSRKGIIAHSDAMKSVLDQAERAAGSEASILLTGETGCGKNLVAGFIHFNSRRREKNFVEVNCAALPETLLESELFGHERGAFTGADRLRVGRFEQADGGTILLDEIGEIPVSIQAKLLLILERKQFQRLGGSRPITVDVRVQAATNRDLTRAINDRTFREDLYYRLNVVTIRIPPLRERPDDVLPLARHFLGRLSTEMNRPQPRISPELEPEMENFPWPGNIRQLRNVLERALLFSDGDVLTPEGFWATGEGPATSRSRGPGPGMALEDAGELLDLDLKANEKRLIEKALVLTGGVQAEAARLLGLTKRALHYRIKKLELRHLVAGGSQDDYGEG